MRLEVHRMASTTQIPNIEFHRRQPPLLGKNPSPSVGLASWWGLSILCRIRLQLPVPGPHPINVTMFVCNPDGSRGREVATSGGYSDAISGVTTGEVKLARTLAGKLRGLSFFAPVSSTNLIWDGKVTSPFRPRFPLVSKRTTACSSIPTIHLQ
jgi:hypothetical protein